MSLRSRFRQFGSQCPSRTPRVAVLSNPTCAPFPHRVHAPGCRAYPSLSCAPSLSKADRAGLLSQYTIPQSGWVSEGHSHGTSFQEIWVAMEIRQQRPAEAVPCFRLVPLHAPFDAAISSCFPFLFPSLFGLALARAETLRPAPGAALLRATPARPPGFGSPNNISNLSQNRLQEILPVPPKKHAASLGSSSLSLCGCPSQNGQKRSN